MYQILLLQQAAMLVLIVSTIATFTMKEMSLKITTYVSQKLNNHLLPHFLPDEQQSIYLSATFTVDW